MKSWKNQWKKELDRVIPSLSEEVKNQQIVISSELTKNKPTFFERVKEWGLTRKKRFLGGIAVSFACILALCFTLPSLFNTTGNDFAIVVEVNPKIVFCANEKGKVISVASLNGDADVILADKSRIDEMIGASIEEATQTFVDYTAKLGYLDFSVNSAIKISGLGNQEKLDGVQSVLEKYFCEKGGYFAVIKENLDKRQFCMLTGLDGSQSTKDVLSSAKSLETLYSTKAEDLKGLYEEVVSIEDEFDEIRASFNQLEQLIIEIDELNNQISEHEDNPLIFVKDYWTLKGGNYNEISEELISLCELMQEKLNVYKVKSGNEVNSLMELFEVKAKLQGLSDLINSDFAENLINGLKEFGFDMTIVENLMEVPTTTAEYVKKISDYYTSRINRFSESYNNERQQITFDGYQNYINGLIEEYGSLTNYWNELKNN